MDVLGELEVLLRRRGYVTRRDAVLRGIPDSVFTHFVLRLRLQPRHRGVWAPAEVDLVHRQAASAAMAAIGEPALVTGASALHLAGAAAAPRTVEIAVPLHRSPVRREGVCVHHTSTFDLIRYRHHGDLRVVGAARAAADFAAHASFTELARVLADADRLRLVTLEGVRAEVAVRRRFAGRGTLRSVAEALSDETTHSGYERLARRLLREAGHRPHPRPFEVAHNGASVAEVDVAFPTLRYGAEIDGPHHLLAAVAAADRVRDRRLNRLGWTIDRFFWFELDQRPAWFVAEVARRVAERTAPSR